MVVVPRQ